VLASLWNWFRRPRPRPDLRFVLYTRAGCHLCETAWETLQDARRRYGFALETVDIDPSPELVAAHGNWVPVVTVNGKVRFRGHVNPVLLRRILDAAPPRHSSSGGKQLAPGDDTGGSPRAGV
jgi:glutaredoxin